MSTWEEKLAAMDHSKGTTDKMRKKAMLAEIRELRQRVLSLQNAVKQAQKRADTWREAANKYQARAAAAVAKRHEEKRLPGAPLSLEVWVVQHEATGEFMPSRMSRGSGKGLSHWQPGPKALADKPFDPSPRLFHSKRAAQAAASSWGSGRRKWHHTSGSSFDLPESYIRYQKFDKPRTSELQIIRLLAKET